MNEPGARDILNRAYRSHSMIGDDFYEYGFLIAGITAWGIMTAKTIIGKTYAIYFAEERQMKGGSLRAVALTEKNQFFKSRQSLNKYLEEIKKK